MNMADNHDIAPTHVKYTRADDVTLHGHPVWVYWPTRTLSFLPDILIDRMAKFYGTQKTKPVTHNGFNAPETMATRLPFETSIAETRRLFSEMHPPFAALFDETLETGTVFTTAPAGKHGAGYYADGKVHWEQDGTINDIIYLAHEFGHRMGEPGHGIIPAYAYTEWQSHFFHHAQFDRLITRDILGTTLTPALENHRYLEGANNILRFQEGMDAAEKLKIPVVDEEQPVLHKKLYDMHYHATAFFIGFGLYQEWKKSKDARRETLMKTLFHTTPDTTPEYILKSFNLWDTGKLECAMKDTLTPIKKTASITPAAPSLNLSF